MSYYGVNIRQFLGARHSIRFKYTDTSGDTDDQDIILKGEASPLFKLMVESREMENGDMQNRNDGFRFNGSVDIYNLAIGDEVNIFILEEILENQGIGLGIIQMYPFYNEDYIDNPIHAFQVYESGNRSHKYIHKTLPDGEIFTYKLNGVKIISGKFSVSTHADDDSLRNNTGYNGIIV